MRRLIIMAMFATLAAAQTKFPKVLMIPQPDPANGTGTLEWQELRANGVHTFGWKAPDALAASVMMAWPTDGVTGFLFSDGAGNTSWQSGSAGCPGCMDLTTNQTASGIKTFTNGIIMQGTSTVRQLNPEADDTYDLGTTVLRYSNIYSADLLSVGSTGGLVTEHTPGISTYYNGSGVQRVLISNAGGISTVSGIIRTFNATDTILSIDSALGVFSAIGFQVGTYGSPIPIIDAAGLVTPVSFQMTAGATLGYCLVSDAAGVGTWQSCSASGSFVTTNTNQTGLTGTKEWNSNHTYNAHILTGGVDTYDIGEAANPWRYYFGVSANVDRVEFATPGSSHAGFWRMYAPTAVSLAIDSASAVNELTFQSFGATDNQWLFRGTLFPRVSPSGNDGDIGGTSNKWRSAYFSATVNAIDFTGQFVNLSGSGAAVLINSGRMGLAATQLVGYDATVTIAKVLLTWGGVGSGIIRTFDNSGNFQNSMESTGFQTNVAYSVGPFGSPTVVIDNAGNAVFPTIRITTAPSAGYVLTSDASGNGSWQAPSGGSFVTTNTNQASLSGTKSWDNEHTFNGGIVVKLQSTARNWDPESDDSYDLGGNGTIRPRWQNLYASDGVYVGDSAALGIQHLGTGISNWTNGSGVVRVQISQAGGASTVSGIVQTSNASGVVNRLDQNGILSLSGFLVGTFPGTTVIDSSRNGSFANLAATGTLSATGAATASSFTASLGNFTTILGGTATLSTSLTTNALTIGPTATVGYCWTATSVGGAGSWQACGSGSFITTNSAQSGMSGDKVTSGTWTYGNSGAASIVVSGSAVTSNYLNSAGLSKVLISNGGSGGGSSGIVRVFDNTSSTINAGMDNTGLVSNVGIVVNGSGGITTTLTVRNSAGTGTCTITLVYGVAIASTC